MSKKKLFLDWLANGVKYNLITETKAKILYEEKYAAMDKMKFLELIYEEA